MVRRQSELFLPTLRDDPADADAISHKLLVRAGMIRQVSAGLWSFLPAGWRTHTQLTQLFRAGNAVRQIAATLQRQPSAIRSRLAKLNLVERKTG